MGVTVGLAAGAVTAGAVTAEAVVAPGVPGVVNLGGVLEGIGVTRFTRMVRTEPTLIWFSLVILFSVMMSSTVLLNFSAIDPSELPATTTYWILVARGRLVGRAVAVGSVVSGPGMTIWSPTLTGQVGSRLLIVINSSRSTLNFNAIP